jgi:hypothetical protein
MRAVIVCGARTASVTDWHDAVTGALAPDWGITPSILMHGACGCDADDGMLACMNGIDAVADQIGRAYGYRVIPMPAAWKRRGLAAGPIRNNEMLNVLTALRACGYAVAVLAFHDRIADSKGTKNMVDKARFARVPYAVYDRNGQEVAYP